MITNIFFKEKFVSHRTLWNRWVDLDLFSNIKRSISLFFKTQYHSGEFSTFFIFLSALLSLYILFISRKPYFYILKFFIPIILICFISGFHDWIVYFFSPIFPILHYFNISRFYFLLPFLWFIIFSVSLRDILKNIKSYPFVIVLFFLLFGFGSVLSANAEFIYNAKLLFGIKIDQPSYDNFFATNLFNDIYKFINKEKSTYRVVSLGIHPSILQLNGFYTLDGYQVSYDANYKIKFRKIIENELNKNNDIRKYFDEWGNKCYIFSSEIGKANMIGKNENIKISNLNLKTNYLKSMGGDFIFSSVEIVNYKSNNLKFESKFTDRDAFYDIYLYKVL
jgi:hypothetical protein